MTDVLDNPAEIADVLCVHELTMWRYANRNRDPLPLVRWGVAGGNGEIRIERWRLLRWKARNDAGANRNAAPDLPIVEGLVVVARALVKPDKTVRGYATRQVDPLPLYGVGFRDIWIWRGALEDWFERQAEPYQTRRKYMRGK